MYTKDMVSIHDTNSLHSLKKKHTTAKKQRFYCFSHLEVTCQTACGLFYLAADD